MSVWLMMGNEGMDTEQNVTICATSPSAMVFGRSDGDRLAVTRDLVLRPGYTLQFKVPTFAFKPETILQSFYISSWFGFDSCDFSFSDLSTVKAWLLNYYWQPDCLIFIPVLAGFRLLGAIPSFLLQLQCYCSIHMIRGAPGHWCMKAVSQTHLQGVKATGVSLESHLSITLAIMKIGPELLL